LTRPLDEKDEKPVVDWHSEPRMDIARSFNLLHRAAFILRLGATGAEERHPVDRATAKKDEKGWLTSDGVMRYRACATSAEDLGAIGGAGLRLYFLVLKALSLLTLLCGVISLPAIIGYQAQDMYDQPEAELYGHLAGAARYGLGNVRVSDQDIDAGRSGVLWLSAITNVLVSIVMCIFTLWIGQHVCVFAPVFGSISDVFVAPSLSKRQTGSAADTFL
jgi:hypothetical protein